MTVDVLIPTLKGHREDSFLRAVGSVDFGRVLVSVEHTARGYVAVMNDLIAASNADVVMCTNDDVMFKPGSIQKGAETLLKRFSDGDGMVGFFQGAEADGVQEYTMPMMGRKFIRRFPEQNPFCPNYLHFDSDTELGEYASSLGRFVFCKEAELYHAVPGRDGIRSDDLRKIVVPMIAQDHRVRVLRRSKGLVWGKSWELV